MNLLSIGNTLVNNMNSQKEETAGQSDLKNENFLNELLGMVELSVKSTKLPDNLIIKGEVSIEKATSEENSFKLIPFGNGDFFNLSDLEKLKEIAKKIKLATNINQNDNIGNNLILNVDSKNKLFQEVDLNLFKKQNELLEKFGNAENKVDLLEHPKVKLIRETTKDLIAQHREFLQPFKAKLGIESGDELIQSTPDADTVSKISEIKESNKSFFENLRNKIGDSNLSKLSLNSNKNIDATISAENQNEILNNTISKLTNSEIDQSTIDNKLKPNANIGDNLNKNEVIKLINKIVNSNSFNSTNNLDNSENVTKSININSEFKNEIKSELNLNNSNLELDSNKLNSKRINPEQITFVKEIKADYSAKQQISPLVSESSEQSGVKFGMENNNLNSGENSTNNSDSLNSKKLMDLFINGKISADSFNNKLSELKQVTNEIKANAKEYIIYKDVQAKNIMLNTANSIKELAPNGSAIVKLNLNPANLGKVFVELNVINNVATLNFKSESKDTIKLIENQINSLVDKLNSQGITTDTISVTQNSKDEQELLNQNKFFEKNSKEHKQQKEYLDSLKNLALLNEMKS